jgi:hypothetical protein
MQTTFVCRKFNKWELGDFVFSGFVLKLKFDKPLSSNYWYAVSSEFTSVVFNN